MYPNRAKGLKKLQLKKLVIGLMKKEKYIKIPNPMETSVGRNTMANALEESIWCIQIIKEKLKNNNMKDQNCLYLMSNVCHGNK
ncbi:hypothetical protein LPTSP2_06610 [Leptospira ellinghausenii]|uniref:Uncharacterized protein n=1 Tax=Leptospira ellinghausenii TaxID=1917822 RepID=A0A2P2D9U1_9LEPT|nr:hypothetical protein LPTSP2_06610 [Leptospira ellinghausenii]